MTVYGSFGILLPSVKESLYPVPISTVFARQRQAPGALVAFFTVPLAPIAALAADLAMPGVAFLHHGLPAKRIPIALTAAWTSILAQERFQRHAGLATGKAVQLF